MLPSNISDVLPQGQGFLRSYVQYATACSDAPPLYHVGVGLTILSASIADRLSCPWLAGRALLPNLYSLLVGPSRSTRKSASMDAGVDVLQAADSNLVSPIPGSYEELVAQLRRHATGLLTYREFGHFLKLTQRGYGEPIRTCLLDLYDWPSNRPYIRNLKKGQTVIEGPICLSMLATIATPLLFSYTDTVEWKGGFFARMLILYGERSEFRMPNTWPEAHAALVEMLTYYAKWKPGPCGGFSENAWQDFSAWSRWRDGKAEKFSDRVQGFVSGSITLAAKVALLYAADAGEPMAGAGWLVSQESMKRAIWFVEGLYLPSVLHLGERLAIGIYENDRQRVLDIIESQPKGITRRDLLRKAKMMGDYMDSITNTLRDEGSVAQRQDHRGLIFQKVRDPGLTLVPPPPTLSSAPRGPSEAQEGED